MTSKLSIITINLNNADGLRKTIESVILQTISDFEYIVIDGASTDGSVDIIKQYSDKITYWISEPDNGVYNAMNKGILKATGDYCLFLNSGDEFSSNKSLIKFNFFFDLNIDILYGDLTVKNGIEEYYKTYPDKLTFKYFRSDTLPHPASFIKRKLFHDICMFDEKLKICSDWEFFVIAICLRNCSYKHIHENISTFYLDGLSSSTENNQLIDDEKKLIINNILGTFFEDYNRLEFLENFRLRILDSKIIKYIKKIGLLKRIKYD